MEIVIKRNRELELIALVAIRLTEEFKIPLSIIINNDQIVVKAEDIAIFRHHIRSLLRNKFIQHALNFVFEKYGEIEYFQEKELVRFNATLWEELKEDLKNAEDF